MAGAVVRSVITPHTPRIGNEATAPEFLKGVIAGSRSLGEEIRALKPEVLVVQSAHWVSTFNWYVTCQPRHEGQCVADEAPDMIPGVAYSRPGDPEFGAALVQAAAPLGVPLLRNDSSHFTWDYGSWVPLHYIDPDQAIPTVLLSTCILASLEECLAVGGAIRMAAERTGRRVVFVASTALAHKLVRGPGLWPPETFQARDRQFIAQLVEGRITEAKAGLREYCEAVVAEAGGRPLATMLGCLDDKSGVRFTGRMHGAYGPSSGSGNASIAVGVAR